MQTTAIEKEIQNKLLGVFSKHALFIESVILFGSRARGDHKRTSDIDLAVVLRNGSEYLTILQDELSQLDIIYGIDLLDYSKIDNIKLKSAIDSEGIKIFETNEKGEIMQTMIKLRNKLVDYEKALSRLHQILERDPLLDDIVVDAGIQRFEFTYELAWKLLKSILEYNGILEATSPRPTIKAAFREGLIVDGMSWLKMLEDRNRTSHTYDEQTAQDIFDHIRNDYIKLFDQLAVRVNAVLEEMVV